MKLRVHILIQDLPFRCQLDMEFAFSCVRTLQFLNCNLILSLRSSTTWARHWSSDKLSCLSPSVLLNRLVVTGPSDTESPRCSYRVFTA